MTRLSPTGAGRPDPRLLLVAVSVCILVVGAVRAVPGLAGALVADGPNSLGEAGKVYYAHRFATGQSIFSDGLAPPHYPSVHGPLLHSAVGVVGRATGAGAGQLYHAGRAISLLLTVGVVLACCGLLRGLGASGWWSGLVAVILVMTPRLAAHIVSYRPDYWLLFISTAACLLIMRKADRGWALALLAVLPTISFTVKAPGIALLPAIFLGLLAIGARRRAVAVAAAGASVFAITLFALQAVSDGGFLVGLRSGANLGYSVRHALDSLTEPVMWIPLAAAPLLWWSARNGSNRESRRAWDVVFVFWALTLATSFAAALRVGSNAYYFLEPLTFGLVLCLAWIHHAFKRSSSAARRGWAAAIVVGVMLLSNPARPTGLATLTLRETRQYGPYRALLADRINAEGLSCFSNDPGLNVLLDRPAVIHPTVQTMLVLADRLDAASFFAPVRAQRYDVILLTEHDQRFRGATSLPDGFREAVADSYRLIPSASPYAVYVPIGREGLESLDP